MSEQKKIQVIIDSTTDLPERVMDQVMVVPLTVSFGEEEFLDGVNLSRNDFYEKLESGDILPKTSQATPATFEKYYEKVREKGMAAVVITVASRLSGTYQSACIAAEEYPEVRVIDSKSVAVGTGILAEYALDCIRQGMELDALAAELDRKREDITLIAMLDTLEFLKRGGRISKTVAFAGGVLNIKPVVTVKDGEVVILGKARGAKKANNLLMELIDQKAPDYELPVLLGYTGTSNELLMNYIEDSKSVWADRLEKLEYSQICSVVGTHAGPGAVAVAYFPQY